MASRLSLKYTRQLDILKVGLVECKRCHCAVSWDSRQLHDRWHENVDKAIALFGIVESIEPPAKLEEKPPF